MSFEANTPELQRKREMQQQVAACYLEPPTHAAAAPNRARSAFIYLYPLTDDPIPLQYLQQLQLPKLTPYQVSSICTPHYVARIVQSSKLIQSAAAGAAAQSSLRAP
jgi:hypothetical protein